MFKQSIIEQVELHREQSDGKRYYVTPDGNKLFFVSARMGSVGGKKSIGNWDIWMSEKQSDGSWGKPQNLGPTVNTSNDERNIFIHPNGKTLFFSSDGYPEKSFGGFDIYRTDFIDGKWTEPVNLGYPVNTQFHEREFVVSTDGKVGWLVANRDFERKDYDIYQVDLKHYNVFTGESEVLSILKGRVIDFSTGLPLKTNIDIKEKEGSYSESISSNSNGNYFNTLVSNKTYILTVSQQGYKTFHKEISINSPIKKKAKRVTSSSRRKKKKTTQTHTVELNLELERENPIEVISKDLFKTQIIAFNATESGYEINDFSKSILEMYARQQIQAPSIVLDISGHFEDVDNANMESKKLADLVINYLKSNGVPENALKVHYMGDSEPISDNDTAIGRAANRRVEIRIVF